MYFFGGKHDFFVDDGSFFFALNNYQNKKIVHTICKLVSIQESQGYSKLVFLD